MKWSRVSHGIWSAFKCMRLFLSEMDGAKNMDFFVSDRGKGIVISTFET